MYTYVSKTCRRSAVAVLTNGRARAAALQEAEKQRMLDERAAQQEVRSSASSSQRPLSVHHASLCLLQQQGRIVCAACLLCLLQTLTHMQHAALLARLAHAPGLLLYMYLRYTNACWRHVSTVQRACDCRHFLCLTMPNAANCMLAGGVWRAC
jgi:hypothetical protein